jgi:hypothetical protein
MKAFPTYHYQRDESGMDLRDYFAAKVLQGLLADYSQRNTMENFARESYELADAMMKAREK